MDIYEQQVALELKNWQRKMTKSPTVFGRLTKGLQTKINSYIPEKVHVAITTAIKQMTRALIFGSSITTSDPIVGLPLVQREELVKKRINFYRNAAATEGAITGAGGILLGLADFPIWLTLKMKMLFEIASLYGYDVTNYKERVYLLYIFQLTFSSQQTRNHTFSIMHNWEEYVKTLPPDINEFEWRNFQQEYRDYIDVAKLLQLIPGVGAPIGAYVNHRLTATLGKMAINAYRMRWRQEQRLLTK